MHLPAPAGSYRGLASIRHRVVACNDVKRVDGAREIQSRFGGDADGGAFQTLMARVINVA